MEYIKYKLTGALIVAFLFLSACNGGDGSGYWKSCRDYKYIFENAVNLHLLIQMSFWR